MFAKLVQISLEVLLRWSSKEKKLQMSYLQQLILFPFLIYLRTNCPLEGTGLSRYDF